MNLSNSNPHVNQYENSIYEFSHNGNQERFNMNSYNNSWWETQSCDN